MNRITLAVERMKTQIQQRIEKGLTTAEAVAKAHKALDMSFEEYCRFQELKSVATTSGVLTLDEAQTIFRYLGVQPETFNKQPIEVKSVLTQLFMELLKSQYALQPQAS